MSWLAFDTSLICGATGLREKLRWLLGTQSFQHRAFVYCAEADINECLSVGV